MSKHQVQAVMMKESAEKAAIGCITRQGFLSVPSEKKYLIFPGFCDVHVHLREPGFSYKETVKTGTMAAARGG